MSIFTDIIAKVPKRNAFDLTHDIKLSGRMGNLMPVMALDCVPGDSFDISTDAMIRLMPMISPVMHRIDATVHYFFVPNRLVWDDWQKFITMNETVAAPFITIDGSETADQKTFLDYMGIPPHDGIGTSADVSAIPFAAYQMIYNEYYRDQNLISEVPFKLTFGDNNANKSILCEMRKRAWNHDYFTSCLPFQQKGAEVDIPLGDVYYEGNSDPINHPKFLNQDGTPNAGGDIQSAKGVPPNSDYIFDLGTQPLGYDPAGTLKSGSTSINNLRRAIKLQEFLEALARGGSRYIELIKSIFGVTSSDKRLDRPEYITGVKAPVIISEVLNTTGQMIDESTYGLPQGNMAGHGVSIMDGQKGSYFCEEHGYIIGILSVMPKTAYQQGIERKFQKFDPLEYYWPQFANIGEQAVLNQEIYAYTNADKEEFGYLPRYTEYKYMNNRVAGEMRSTLNFWHLGRKFSTLPTLSQQFLEIENEDVARIFAVTDQNEDHLICHIVNKIKAIRPMPVYGTPHI